MVAAMAIQRYVGELGRRCRRVLLRTSLIAVVVGTLLTVVNQLEVLASGRIDLMLVAKVATNYLIPFAVATFGAMANSDGR